MRAREEQAKSLRDSLSADYKSVAVHQAGYELAMRHIEEAEARAEACVRAEIARDSERLDWLDAYGRNNGGVFIPFDPNDSDDYPHPHLRSAIDAAREVG
jgi:hypothetical protein